MLLLLSPAHLLSSFAALGLDEEDNQEGTGDEDAQEDGEIGREGDGHAPGKRRRREGGQCGVKARVKAHPGRSGRPARYRSSCVCAFAGLG